MEIQFTIDTIRDAAAALWSAGKTNSTWAFHGEMGVGKTTFIHHLCRVLEITSAISSPTYSIINEYTSPIISPVYHMDWYRLRDEEEAIQAGVEDVLSGNALYLIEWPERAEGLLPEDTLHIYLSLINSETRHLSVPAL